VCLTEALRNPYDTRVNYGAAWDAVVALARARRGEDFTTADLAKFLAISRQSAHAWLKRFVEDKRLVPVGHGRATRYRVAPYDPPRIALTRPAPQIATSTSTARASVWGGGVPTLTDAGTASATDVAKREPERD